MITGAPGKGLPLPDSPRYGQTPGTLFHTPAPQSITLYPVLTLFYLPHPLLITQQEWPEHLSFSYSE